MGKVVLDMSISRDGFAAGPDVTIHQPMGKSGERLHKWLFAGKTEVDSQIISTIFETSGAVIVGGQTYNVAANEAWGGISPFLMPAFVVTQTIPEQKIDGFTYVTDGIESALSQAQKTAGEKNVWIMGGANLSQSLIKAGSLDEMHIHIVPVLMGNGIRLFENIGSKHIELVRTEMIGSHGATHLFFRVLK